MKVRDASRKTKIERARWLLLLPAVVLLLTLLSINIVLFVSEYMSHRTAPPPPRLVPLPVTGWLVWLLWLGPLIVVLLLYGPSIVGAWRVQRAVQASQPVSVELGGNTPRAHRSGCISYLRLFILLLAILAQFMVMGNARSFDTSGVYYMDNVATVSHQEAWATGFFDYNVGSGHSVLWHYTSGKWTQVEGPDVSHVTALPNGEVWGIGDAGWLEHESRGTWTQVSSGTTDPLHAIAMRTPTDGWAVGGYDHTPIANVSGSVEAAAFPSLLSSVTHSNSYTDCRIVHGVTNHWTSVPCPVTEILNSVAVLPSGEAWAVGRGGTILHEVGGTWTKVKSPTRYSLNSVVMVSATEGWAVGEWGTILHSTQGIWRLLSLPTPNYLDQVTMVNPDEGWIVGDRGTLLHYHQKSWQKIPLSDQNTLFSISLNPSDANDGWIVGADYGPQPQLWRMQGASWHHYQAGLQ